MQFYCNNCKNNIEESVYKYSVSNFGKALCLNCQNSTPEARKLADALNKLGWDAVLEKPVSRMHIDISVKKAKVNIEVDGTQHSLDLKQAMQDLKRTCFTFNRFWITLRVPNSIVRNKEAFDEAVGYIHKFLSENVRQLKGDVYDKICDFIRGLFSK